MGKWKRYALEELEPERDSLEAEVERLRESQLGLRAALAGFDAQYGKRSLAEQHPELPSGAVQRIEAVVRRAYALLPKDRV